MDYGMLISLGLDSLESLIEHFTKAKAPTEVIESLKAAYDNVEKHGQDTMTKDEWDALRG